jgi:hypothetical protein
MRKVKILSILLVLMVLPGIVHGAEKTITTYTWDRNIQVQPEEPGGEPRNRVLMSISGGSILSVLNTSGTGNKVASVTYNDSSGCTSVWAVFSNFSMIPDPENTGCSIGSLVVPLTTTATEPLRQSWTTYKSVSYDVQVKVGWYQTLDYAAQGINIRWQESSTPGKYEGYGISFINFDHRSNCTPSSRGDYLPIDIKPGPGNSLQKKLLMVLWMQRVVSGVERRDWLAYAVLGEPGSNLSKMNDPKVIGGQTSCNNQGLCTDSRTITDNATLLVRVEDRISGAERYNDIKIYYGDPSVNNSRTSGTRGLDTVATNINRGLYPPKCSAAVFPIWPGNTLEPYTSMDQTFTYWSYMAWHAAIPYVLNNVVIPTQRFASDGLAHSYRCTTAGTSGNIQPVWPVASGATVSDGGVVWRENGTSRPTSYDYFTLLSANPLLSNNSVRLVMNSNLPSTVLLQPDRATIRTTEFTLSDYPAGKPEIALHGMGGLTGSDTVAFNDLAVQILGRRE